MAQKPIRPKRAYSLVLEEQVHKRLSAAAELDRRTISGYLNYMLDRTLPKLPAQADSAYNNLDEDGNEIV